ncbi:MAG TPA: hypothetical protein VJV79_20700 [Polyangiaceae bacterium]|nr:hypothetical protein [Polyangiaceae bacterium]
MRVSKAMVVVVLLACACSGSPSDGSGAGGMGPGVILGKGGAGGGSGANGLAGSSNSAAGSGSSGAGHSAGAPSSASACPVVTPCGGDPVGDWTVKQQCVTTPMDSLASFCDGASLTISPLTVSGTVSFKADKTISSSGVISFTESVVFPASCVAEMECTDLETALVATANVTSGQCDYDAVTGCSCQLAFSQNTMSSGTYEVQGTNLSVTTATSAQPQVDSFCVSGNTLSIYQSNVNGTSATLILTK